MPIEPNPVKLSWRFKIGVIFLVAIASYSIWLSFQYYDIGIFLRRLEKFGVIASDKLSQFETQLSCLRTELATGERVGFISSLKDSAWTEVYLWTQYALAPIIVIPSEAPEKLIAVYPGKDGLDQAKMDGYVILVNCHQGIGLVTAVNTK